MGSITLNHITKIEGHAHLDLKIKNNKVEKCELGSIEGSRYFEGLLKGRKFNEAQEVSTRICGICSSAHNVAAILAVENALNIKPSSQTIALRNLQTIGERIRSHATHLHFLSLPDFLGFESALEMAPKFKEEVQRALRLMKLGNDMLTIITGRALHPISPAIGGFHHLPEQSDLDRIKQQLIDSEEDVLKVGELFVNLDYPNLERPTQYMSIYKKDEFGMSYGDIKIDGKTFKQQDYHNFLKEYHEEFSTANFVVKEDKSYALGALARFNNSPQNLSLQTRNFMKKWNISFPSDNPFDNLICQALELIHYREECIKILDNLEIKPEKENKIELKAGHGIAANEAPRGTLWHEYKLDKKGTITHANIITPTCQFLRNLNEDISFYVQSLLDQKAKKQEMVTEIEKLIRSYDPCFSCSSHFLKVNWL